MWSKCRAWLAQYSSHQCSSVSVVSHRAASPKWAMGHTTPSKFIETACGNPVSSPVEDRVRSLGRGLAALSPLLVQGVYAL